ncbi:TIGR02281 family clan AA aspartic protease [Rhodobacteraceae bacterium WD3A24]|nr:TIGR02281 family clan AA aspartic protease [Rhodobacteraceae bacterium WD3A24]
MDGEIFGRMMYLLLLGAAVLSWVVLHNLRRPFRAVQQMLAWTLIFIGMMAAYGLWEDIRDDLVPRQAVIVGDGRVEVPRSHDGHYYLHAEVNGASVRFVFDTGATDMVLTRADARAAGIEPGALVYRGRARTANGTVSTARVMLDTVVLGDITDRDVRAWVNSGEMDTSLMGMGYLDRFARVEIADDRLILVR